MWTEAGRRVEHIFICVSLRTVWVCVGSSLLCSCMCQSESVGGVRFPFELMSKSNPKMQITFVFHLTPNPAVLTFTAIPHKKIHLKKNNKKNRSMTGLSTDCTLLQQKATMKVSLTLDNWCNLRYHWVSKHELRCSCLPFWLIKGENWHLIDFTVP